jgi:uncharacterized protein
MIHLITDEELTLTLQRLQRKLCPDGSLIIRATVPSGKRLPWKRWIETARIRARKGIPYFRSLEDILAIIAEADFKTTRWEIGRPGEEEWWFVAQARQPAAENGAAEVVST